MLSCVQVHVHVHIVLYVSHVVVNYIAGIVMLFAGWILEPFRHDEADHDYEMLISTDELVDD